MPTASPTKSPTKAPTLPCSDSYENWYDVDGPQYDCDWYASNNNCAIYGDLYANPLFGGTTANQACCVCGGGLSGSVPTKSPTKSPSNSPTNSPTKSPTKTPTKSPTNAPTMSPTKSPTMAPTKSHSASPSKAPVITNSPTKAPISICYDSPENWYDADGPDFSCDWYATDDNCANYGDSYANPTFGGTTANQACCVCGGGSSTPPPSSECANTSDGSVEVTITTDVYSASENFFFVKDSSNQKVWQEYGLQNDTTETFYKCLPKNKCYRFIIRDTYGDGLIGGNYSVKWEGDIIKESNFASGKRESSPWFGNC